MGDWGARPWDNDEGADWFLLFNESSNFDQIIGQTIAEPFDGCNRDTLRAAICTFILLGRVYVYPPGSYFAHLDLCIERLKELKQAWFDGEWDGDSEIGKDIDFSLQYLERRKACIGKKAEEMPHLSEELLRWLTALLEAC
ncbi:MAG TPA: hypothetical protein PLY72_18635 [Candidatus Obscuribacter sp.]|nr:hypothetical protein [Candidatus Obscuribacter sp.]HNG76497.1 hypothetical protein [Candidatus Obscuribacter sp.]